MATLSMPIVSIRYFLLLSTLYPITALFLNANNESTTFVDQTKLTERIKQSNQISMNNLLRRIIRNNNGWYYYYLFHLFISMKVFIIKLTNWIVDQII